MSPLTFPERDEGLTFDTGTTSAGGSLREPDEMTPAMRRRRAYTLLLSTLVVPGSAQLSAGNRRLGKAGVRVWLCLIVGAVGYGLLLLANRSAAFGLVARSGPLLAVVIALVVGAILWAVLFVDAWRLAEVKLMAIGGRRVVSGLTGLLVFFTSGSMLFVANQVSTGRDLFASIFSGTTARGAALGRYNVLLLGGDSGADRTGTRPDSINLVSVNAHTGRSVMFGFARDTENINFRPGSLMKRLMPGGWNCGDQCLLNGLYTWGSEHRAKFPATVKDPGVEATREAVEALSGVAIQYYVLIDLHGFQQLVNAVGGLTVDVKQRTPIGGGTSRVFGYIEPGVRHLDGYHALWYARSRHGSNNYERMARQRCVMTAMLKQLNPQSVLLKFQELAAAGSSTIHTDLPQDQLGMFVDLVLKAKSQKLTSVNFVPPLINPWSYDPTVIRSRVSQAIAGSAVPKAKTVSGAAAPARSAPSSGSAGAASSDVAQVCSAA
jgi:LCP family protein required for cell wall assembly